MRNIGGDADARQAEGASTLTLLPRYIGAFRNKVDGGGYVAHLISSDPTAIERFARHYDKPGISIYDCPNSLLSDATTRDKESIAEQSAVWVDVDLKDLVTPRDLVREKLLALPLPLEIRDSGGGGYHVGAYLKESEPRDTPEFERINEIRAQLLHMLCGDPNVDHHAHLLRRPGTHNSNYDVVGECRTIRPGKPVDITEVEALIELCSAPLFERKPQARRLNGQTNGSTSGRPFDLEEWAAELYYPGNIHIFERQGTASLISSGVDLACAVDTILDAVRAYTERCPPRRPWNWDRERRRVERMSYSWINKHPDELAAMLPDPLFTAFQAIETAGGKPEVYWATRAKERQVRSKTPIPVVADSAVPKKSGWQSYSTAAAVPMEWSVKRILMKYGITTLSGQWATYKTTVALYLSFSLMTGTPFAGRYRIKRRGAVLYFAVEGAGGIVNRLRAIAEDQGHDDPNLPFKFRSDCPPLKERTSVATLCRYYDEALAELRAEFGNATEIVAVFFDTWARASGADDKGDDDDKGVTGAILKTLIALQDHAKCICVPLDHFGKDMSRGTRGSSDKESIDGLLATLGERGISGPATNTRLAVRKVKDAEAGFEIPFTPRVIETGVDDDGDPTTAILLDWGHPQDSPVPVEKLSSNVELLRASLDAAIAADEGKPLERRGGSITAVPEEAVRRRFLADFKPAKGKPVAEDTARRLFDRALAEDTKGVGRRTAKGVTWLWRNTTVRP